MPRTRELKFACALCQKRFPDSFKLNRRMSKHSDSKLYECLQCSKKFKWEESFHRHKLIHNDKCKIYHCDQCRNAKFVSKSALRAHLSTVHNKSYDPRWDCVFCDKKLNSARAFQIHISTHTKEKPNFCKFCDKEFNTKRALVAHIPLHNPDRQTSFECSLCSKQFFSNDYLQKHLRIHLLEKSHKCQICNKSFVQKAHLTIHLRLHTGEKPFSCQNCGKNFSQGSHQKSHSRICTANQGDSK